MSKALEPTWLQRFAAPFIHLFAWLLARVLPRHLRGLLYTRHLPRSGPLIVVANHQSYFDGQLIAILFYLLTGRRVYSVSNVIAFRGWFRKLYYEIVGDIRVDPRDAEGTYARLGRELAGGKVLLMYPEGHRSDGSRFLPFRFGAFNLAVRLNVPLLPVGLRDTGKVIPKGKRWFQADAAAAVAFGELVYPEHFARQLGLEPRACAARMCRHVEDVLRKLVYDDESSMFTPLARAQEAEALAARTRDELELLLDDGAENIGRREAARVLRIARVGRTLGVHCPALETQFVRAYGFWVGALPALVALFLLGRFRRMIEARLEEDAQDPYASYVLGQFHLQVPRLLGGNRARAVEAMHTAYVNAAARGLSPSRFVVGYATALSAQGARKDAIDLLLEHFGRGPEDVTSTRLVRRWQRAQRLLASLTVH